MKRTLLFVALAIGGLHAITHLNIASESTSENSKSTKTKALEVGSRILQEKKPIDQIHVYVCGFHFYNGDINRQVRADHYCAHLNEDVRQCVIYDSNKPDARLIGVEYIISEKLFKTLPEEEKKLWHSHRYEVMSGELIAPGIPEVVEKELMKDLVTTYGKTWHFWQVDRGDELPLGLPKLMMAFTEDGQTNAASINKRNKEYHINSEELRKKRAAISVDSIAEGADAWQKGDSFQLDDSLLQAQPSSANKTN